MEKACLYEFQFLCWTDFGEERNFIQKEVLETIAITWVTVQSC